MPSSKAIKLRKAYEFKLGKKLVSKLSDEQISLLSKFYNSLSESEQRNIDNKIFKGYNDTELHEMAEGFFQEQEDTVIEPIKPEPKVTTIKASAIVPAKLFGEDRYQKYIDELTAEGTIDGKQLTPAERKEGFKKRGNKIDFEKFITKVLQKKDAIEVSTKATQPAIGGGGALVRSPKMDIEKFIPPPVTEKTQENLDEILKGIDSILETLKEDQKLKKKKEDYDRKQEEKERRKLQESRLEKRFSGLRKAAEKIIAPVKGILDRILQFFVNILLGRIVYKLIEWMADPENKGKIDSILRFIKDWWPALLSAYILFGTSFGRFTRSILSTVGKFIFKIGKKAIPQLMRFAAKNPVTAALVAGGALAAGGAYMASQQNEKRREEAAKKDPTIVTPKQTAETGKTPPPSQLQQEYIQQRGLPMFSGGGLNTKNFFGDNESAGYVSGEKGVDKVPAMLSDGEFVMSTGAVKKYGVQTLEAMNAAGGGTNKPKIMQGVSYAAGGGMVGQRKMIGDSEPPSPEKYGGTPKESTSMMDIPSGSTMPSDLKPSVNLDLNYNGRESEMGAGSNQKGKMTGGGSKISGAAGNFIMQKLKQGPDFSAVREHPEHGGVRGKHAPNSYHYSGRAIDVGAYAYEQGPILRVLEQFNKLNNVRPVELLHAGNEPGGHSDHVHAAYQGGGEVQKFNLLNPFSWFSGRAQGAIKQADQGKGSYGGGIAGSLLEKRRKQAEAMKMLRGYQSGGLIKENTGIDIPGGAADRQLIPHIAVQPGEVKYIVPKDSVDRGAIPLINMIVAATDSNSKAYKDGFRSKIPGPPVKSSPKVTVISAGANGTGDIQPVSVPSGAPSFNASSASRSKVNTLGIINF